MTARVLWLTKGLGLGGAERLLVSSATGLDRSRFDVEVAYLLPWKDAFVPDLEAAGVPAVCLEARHTLDPRWPPRLARLLRRGGYDLVHTHSPVPAAVARMVTRDGPALVHTEHNVWQRYRWPTYLANAATYGRNDAVIAVSDGVAQSIAPTWWARDRRWPAPVVLHHGVDVEGAPRGGAARTAARDRLGLAADVPVVANVANLTPKKDHATLLAAVDRLRTAIPDVVVLLVGTGPLADQLESTVHDRGLEDHVRFLGLRDDVLELLPASDVFVLSSRYEGLPISLLEAMAAEVACVATRVGGVPEAITDDRHGRLVEPADAPALAGALQELLEDDDLRAGIAVAGRERVRERFSMERAVARIQEVYDDALAGRASANSPTA